MKRLRKVAVCVILLLVSMMLLAASLKPETGSFDGFTLFSPLNAKTTYLIDNSGRIVHTWKHSAYPGVASYFTETGKLLRPTKIGDNTFNAGGVGGTIELIDWNGDIAWSYRYSSSKYCQHHDVKALPNGNIIFIAWDRMTKDEAIQAGRSPKLLKDGELWPDSIIEVKPTGAKSGSIEWEWHLRDHLVQDFDKEKDNYGRVDAHPELVDMNYIGTRNAKLVGGKDWTHVNSVAYNEDLDQIVISVHGFNEIWVIDHSTTTAQARTHKGGRYGRGGDLLYRWGNPAAYKTGGLQDQVLFGQHDAKWVCKGLVGEGNILVFNNGLDRVGPKYSSIIEIKPPLRKDGTYTLNESRSYGPKTPVWEYKSQNLTDFYSSHVSGAQRLPNGNTLICSGTQGAYFEVTRDGRIVWNYSNKFTEEEGKTGVFKVERYAPGYKGLAGKMVIK